MIKQRVVSYQPVDIDRKELITLAEASRMVGMSLSNLIGSIERGVIEEYIDTDAGYHYRRLLRKADVIEKLGNKIKPA